MDIAREQDLERRKSKMRSDGQDVSTRGGSRVRCFVEEDVDCDERRKRSKDEGRESGGGVGVSGRFEYRDRAREENGRGGDGAGGSRERERDRGREGESSRERQESRRCQAVDEDSGRRRRRSPEGYESEREERRKRAKEGDGFRDDRLRSDRKVWSRDSERRPYLERDGLNRERVVFRPRIREGELQRENEQLRSRERERVRERERGKEVNVGEKVEAPKEKFGQEIARKYQLEVLAQAKLKNTIAFLETGAGKTLIAVLLMKYKYETMRQEGKRMLAVFLVPKVPLVYQQAEVIRDGTGFHVGHYCGEMGQDFWDARRWQREFDTKDVLVMTAQILLNILRHSIVRMEAIHLLILDECHHAVKKHPYSLVMSEFYHITAKEKRPCVFGMTASPVNLKGVSNQEDCAIKIRNLESKLDSIVCTIKDRRELEKHVPMPSETMVQYDKPALLFSLREEVKQMEAAAEEAANASAKRSKWRFMGARDAGSKEELRLVYGVAERTESDGAASLVQKLRAIIYALDELGQWCAYKVALAFLTSFRNDERIHNQLDVKFQETYLKKVCALLKCSLREGAVGSKDPAEIGGSPGVECEDVHEPMDVEEGELPDTQVVSGGEHVDEILGAAVADGKVTPKVQSLIKILLGYQHTDDFRAIIFVERVVAAQILPKVFAELPSLKFVKCACLIGHNNNQDMRTRQMQDTISRFRDGRVTLLVATSVAEEGLDIRKCNVVIRFDLAKTVLAYIQSRGRARKPGSDYILMLERGNLAHEAFLRNAKNSEETLRKEAIERTDLGALREAAIMASVDVGEGEIYQVEATGAVVSMNSAVGLVHFYCSQLPSDRYSILRPEFIMSRHERQGGVVKYSCKLQLPCNAPLENIEGPLSTSIRGAQQAVCLEACKKLHEMGEFTDMLLPDKGSSEEVAKQEGSEEGEPSPGTARHREYYPEGIAEILKGDWIVADKEIETVETSKVLVFMYKVKCENLGFSKDSLLTETSEFAFLVGQELSEEVLSMSMDLFVARTMTTKAFLLSCGPMDLSLSELASLKSFHVRLMSIVLDVDVEPATTPWDPVKAYLFVPVVDKVSPDAMEMVDWDLVKRTIETEAWKNPLQRARPDVYLGTDERALGGDRREYGFGKLRSGLAFGQKAHPTYGIRGAIAQFDVVRATGLLPAQDIVQKEHVQEVAPEGKLLLADGYVGLEGLAGKIVTAVHSGKRFYVDSVRVDMTADSSFPQKDGYLGPLEYSSYADYYKQKYGVELICKKQPLLRGRGVSHCKNLLSPRFETSDGWKLKGGDLSFLKATAIQSAHHRRVELGSWKISILRKLEKEPCSYTKHLSMGLQLLSWIIAGGAPNSQEPIDKTYYVMLPPELCLVHPLPGPLVRGAQRLPSVMRRVESMLLAVQLKHQINFPIAATKVLEALTAASCQETFSYERAELLGDAYLKWVVSRRLFLKFPSKHEGQLTRMRQQTVSNSVLYQFALEKGLQSYIQADRFAPSRWAAPGVPPVFDEDAKDGDDNEKEKKAQGVREQEDGAVEESGKIESVVEELIEDDLDNMEDGEIEGDSSAYRVLSSKTLADVVEAFIGIYYVEGGQRAATHLMDWIGIPVEFDVAEGELAQAGCQVPETVLRSINFEALEGHIGHKFRERSLLVEAITHASRPSSGVPCYQRLEFVGDAVLDHLITRFLFFSYTDLPPGRLTDLRAAAVNNENFARVAVKHKFHLHLRHGSSALETQIRNFVKDIQTELDKPGVNSFGLGDFKAPKVLGDVLESIAGALFLDTGLDTSKVWKVFEPLLQPMVTPETLPMHPVRELQERCQQQAEGLEYKATRADNVATVEVYVDGVQIGSAQNAQKKMAQKLAARNALVILKEKEVIKEEAAKAAAGEAGEANSGRANTNGNTPFTRQALNDLCLKRQWPMPQYKCTLEGGPAHAKRFTFSVRVHTTESGWTEECIGEPMPSVKKAKDSAAVLLLAHLRRR